MANEVDLTAAAPSTTPSWPAGLAGALLLVAVMLGGILALGRVASSDVVAMIITSIFLVAVAVWVGVFVLRRRSWFLPLGPSNLLVPGGAGVVWCRAFSVGFTEATLSQRSADHSLLARLSTRRSKATLYVASH